MFTLRGRAMGVVAGLAAACLVAGCTSDAPAATDTRAKVTLPSLTGQYPVGTTDLHVVDTRQDPFHPGDKREIMVTVSYPALPGGERAAWMAPRVVEDIDKSTSDPKFLDLPAGKVNWGGVQRQARSSAAVDRTGGEWPVVLFSPGFGAPREIYAGLTDDLASRGYVVVSISHNYDSGVVEFPGGRVVVGNPEPDDKYFATDIDARVADSRFVLDQLTRLDDGTNPDAENRQLPQGLVGALDLSKVGMFGHSFGGYAAGETMYQDRRVAAGINFDGGMSVGRVGAITEHGVDRPFMLVGADFVDKEKGRTLEHSHLQTELDPSWQQFWANQQAWKRDLHFDHAGHNSFTDLQIVLPQIADLLKPEPRQQQIGDIDPARSLTAQQNYLAAFFDLHLKGGDGRLFEVNSPPLPDTRFIP
ncbi:alpha/beta hydrolase family protein [Nocardia altamirensis]|uniref:alpha/beta hydrolase family protein n=1 Tax=Nocardia altamirensis TaxID=472158 RepID=UPI001C3F714E|nr:hypothetical protein [Nocardia altamirensis]